MSRLNETTRWFTPAMAAALTGTPEKRVRKEIELGIVKPRRRRAGKRTVVEMGRPELLYLKLVASRENEWTPGGRARLLAAIKTEPRARKLVLGPYLTVETGAARASLDSRLRRYTVWRRRLWNRKGIMGGETVLPGTRLLPDWLGGRVLGGDSIESVLEDYPYISREDVEFCVIFRLTEAGPGRPPSGRKISSHRIVYVPPRKPGSAEAAAAAR